MSQIPEYYKKSKMFNWAGIYYYNQEPYEETKEEPEGTIIESVNDYPAGIFKVYSNGIIDCKTICGSFRLKKS